MRTYTQKKLRSEGIREEKGSVYPEEARNEVLEKEKDKKLQEKPCNFLPLYLIPYTRRVVHCVQSHTSEARPS